MYQPIWKNCSNLNTIRGELNKIPEIPLFNHFKWTNEVIVFFCVNRFYFSAGKPKEATWWELWDGTPSKIYVLAIHFAWSMYVLNFNCVVLGIRMYGRDHLSINTVAIGFSEIIGVFIGMYIVLYTSRRWLWAGSAGIITGLLGYFIWFIPRTSKKFTLVSEINQNSNKTYSFIFVCLFDCSERNARCCIGDGTNNGY